MSEGNSEKVANETNTGSKIDEDVDINEILKRKIKLSDDTEEFLFSRGPKYNEKLWPIQCHLCRVGYMINEKKLRAHLNSEKHINRLSDGIPDAESYRKPYEQLYSDRMRLMNPIKINPGEFIEEVTTELADRLMPCKNYNWEDIPSEQIIEELMKDNVMEYNEKTAIFGLCYAFKMYDSSKKMKYYCSLCNCYLYDYNAYQHFIGIEGKHVNEYISRHFSMLKNRIESLYDKSIKEIERNKYTNDIIRHIYNKLENWKGRRQLHMVDGKLFDAQRPRFLAKARKLLHYNDQAVIFSDAEIRALIQKCRNFGKLCEEDPDRLPNQPPAPSRAEIDADNRNNNDEQKKRRLDNNSGGGGSNKKSARIDNNNRNQKNGPKLNESPENWRRYENLVERTLKKLNEEYGSFVDMSERHPQYRAEWNNFWRMRSRELEQDNINPNTYDFMPEWNRYWLRYLENCYQADVKKCKFEIRKNLRLPFRQSTPEPQGFDRRQCGNNSNNNNNNNDNAVARPLMPLQSLGFNSPNRGGNNYNNNSNNGNNSNRNNRNQNSSAFNNNNSGGNFGNSNNNQAGPVPLMGIGNLCAPETMQQEQEIELPTEPLSVLSVLRLLTALEDQLGSLGPTAIQLLSKAIFFEKDSNSSANELLNENEYFKLFITSLEKLRGQIYARIVPTLKIKAVQKAIDDLDSILTLFDEYKRRNSDQQSQQSNNAGQQSSNMSSVNSNVRHQSDNNQYNIDQGQWRSDKSLKDNSIESIGTRNRNQDYNWQKQEQRNPNNVSSTTTTSTSTTGIWKNSMTKKDDKFFEDYSRQFDNQMTNRDSQMMGNRGGGGGGGDGPGNNYNYRNDQDNFRMNNNRNDFNSGGNNSSMNRNDFNSGGNNSSMNRNDFNSGGNNSGMNRNDFNSGGNNSGSNMPWTNSYRNSNQNQSFRNNDNNSYSNSNTGRYNNNNSSMQGSGMRNFDTGFNYNKGGNNFGDQQFSSTNSGALYNKNRY